MADSVSTERDVKDFKFQQLCKIRVGPESGDNVQSKRSQLLASSNKYGLIIVGCEQALKVYQINAITRFDLEHLSERNTLIPNTFPVWCHVDLQQPAHFLGLSCDDLTLAVCIKEQHILQLLLYDTRSFADKTKLPQPFLKTQINGGSETELLDIAWNPTSPNLCAVCTTDGYLELFEVTDTLKTIASLPAKTGATCLCWSPKGKQLVVGKKDGTLTQYDQELKEKKKWPLPSILDGDGYQVLDLVWISTYMFAAAYISSTPAETDQPQLVMTVSSKEGNTSYINFDDVCYGNGEENKRKYFLNLILQWEMVICSSNNALETVVVGKNLDDKVSWERWNLDDSWRAEMPLTEDHNDTFPVGMVTNTSSQQAIPLGDNKELPPCPLLFCYSSDGLLIPYYMVYSHKDAININSAAQPLTAEGARIDKCPAAARPSTATIQPTTGTTGVFGPGLSTKSPFEKPANMFPAGGSMFNKTIQPGPNDSNATKTAFGGAPAFNTTLSKEAGKSTFGAFGANGAQSPASNTGFSGFAFQNKQVTTSGPSSQPSSSEAVKTTVTGGGNMFGTLAKPGLTFGQLITTSATVTSSVGTSQTSGFSFSTKAGPSFGQTVASFGTGTSQPLSSFGTKISQPQVTEITSTKQLPEPTNKATSFGGFNVSTTNQAGNVLGSTNQSTAPFTAVAPPSKPPSAFSVPSSQTASSQPSFGSTTMKRPSESTVVRTPQPSLQPAQQPHPSVIVSKVPNQSISSPSPAIVQQKASVPAPSTPIRQSVPVQPTITQASTTPKVTTGKEDTTFNRTIIEEMKHFEKELQDLQIRSRNLSSQIGTKDEMISLKKHTNNVEVFSQDIKETTKAQNKEIEDERARCLDAFATVEESKVRQEKNCDPHYHHLLKTKSLDPASGLKMRQLQQEYQILERGAQEADSILETQWQEYQEKKKNKSRLTTPTMENLYRALKANRNVISNFRNSLENIEVQLKEIRLYNRTSPWKNQLSSSRTTDGKAELTSLANSLLEDSDKSHIHSSSANRFCKYPAITPEKQALLRRHLSQRVVPKIKSTVPASLSVSRLAAAETIKYQTKPAESISTTDPEKDFKPLQTHNDMNISMPTEVQEKPSTELKSAKEFQPSSIQKPESITPELQKQPVFNFGDKSDKSAFITSTPAHTITGVSKSATGGQSTFSVAPNTAGSVNMFGVPAVTAFNKTHPPPFTKTPADQGTKVSIYPKLDDITPPSSVTPDEDEDDINEDEDYDNEDEDSDDEEEEESEEGESDEVGFGHQYNITKKEMDIRNDAQDKTLKDLKQSATPDVTPTKASSMSSTTKPNISGVPKNLFGTPTAKEFAFGSPSTGFQDFKFGESKPPGSAITASGISTTASFPAATVQSTEDKKIDKKGLFDTSAFNSFTKGNNETKSVFGTKPSTEQIKTENVISTVNSTGRSVFGNSTSPGKFTFSVTPKASPSNDKPLFGLSSFAVPSTEDHPISSQNVGTAHTSVISQPADSKAIHSSVPLDAEAQNSLLRGLLAQEENTNGTDASPGQTTPAFQLGQALTSACISPGSSSTSPPASGFIATSTGLQNGGVIGSSGGSVFSKPSIGTPKTDQTEKNLETQPKSTAVATVSESTTPASAPVIESSNSETATVSAVSTGLFGTTGSTSTSGILGSSTSTTGKSVFGTLTSQTKEQGGSLFGTTTTSSTGSGSFSASSVFSTSVTTTGTIFSTQATTTASSAFGISSTSSQNNVPSTTTETVVKSLFGQPTNQASQASTNSIFGSSATQSGGFGQTSTTSTFGSGGSIFGSTSQPGTNSVFGQTTQSSVFGQSAFGTAATTTSSSFGSGSTFGQTGPTSGFGKPAAFGQPAAFGSTLGFGQSATTTASSSPSSFGGGSGEMFSGLGGKPSEEKANTNVFGSPQQFGEQAQPSASLFGNQPASKFGENVNKSPGVFGGGSGVGNNVSGAFSSTAGSVSSTGFGTAGQQPQAQSPSGFGSSPSFGSGQTGFGGSGASAFGAKPSFGTSPSFGGSAFGSAPAFSSPVAGSTFGSSTQQQGSSGGGFASFAGSSSPTFGTLAQTSDKPPSFGGMAGGGTTGGFGGSPFGGSSNTSTGFGNSQGQSSAFGSSPSFSGYRG